MNTMKRRRTTKYEVRAINADGDVIDVNHFDTWTEARDKAPGLVEYHDAAAYVIERHMISVMCDEYGTEEPHSRNDHYQTMTMSGDDDALVAGGWKDGDE